jgi:hypothetical protein
MLVQGLSLTAIQLYIPELYEMAALARRPIDVRAKIKSTRLEPM